MGTSCFLGLVSFRDDSLHPSSFFPQRSEPSFWEFWQIWAPGKWSELFNLTFEAKIYFVTPSQYLFFLSFSDDSYVQLALRLYYTDVFEKWQQLSFAGHTWKERLLCLWNLIYRSVVMSRFGLLQGKIKSCTSWTCHLRIDLFYQYKSQRRNATETRRNCPKWEL